MQAVVLSVASRAVLEACEQLGMDIDGVLQRAGVDRATVYDPDARLTPAQADGIWREAMGRSPDPDLALRSAEAVPFGAYAVLDYLVAASPTLGEGLRRVSTYFRLVDPRGEIRISETGERPKLVFGTPQAGGKVPPPAQQYTWAILVLRGRHVTRKAWVPARVAFTFPEPPQIGEYLRIFGVKPEFGAAEAEIEFARETWSLPAGGSEPRLLSILEAHARLLIEKLPVADELVAGVEKAITSELSGGDPSITRIGRKLAMSPRTLQRRLAEAGTNYGAVLDGVRLEWAKMYLAQPGVALCEVSWLLGFSEQSAFNRSFKRWTGLSPGRYRQQLGGVAAARS